ncbi:Fc.00g041480.m01.CDS01 [Cosmosporella sp. VM-42]
MKYSIAVLAPVLMASAEALLHLDTNFKLPLGIDLPINLDIGPTSEPPEDCIDTWHPPHHGVDMDGCDNDGDDSWHWVHPGQPAYPDQPPHVWTTQVVTATHVSTVIDCAHDVPNCHGRVYTTVVVPETTTICPIAVTTAYPGPTTEVYPPPATTTNVYVPPHETTSCPPEEEEATTWDPPVETTTPCPEEESTTWYPPVETTTPCDTEIETSTWSSTWSSIWTTSTSWVYEQPSVSTPAGSTPHPTDETSAPYQPPVETRETWYPTGKQATPPVGETPAWTSIEQPPYPSTPISPPIKTVAYPPPAGYTTAVPTGQPGYCPGPGCPSQTTVGTVTHPVYQTPTTSVVQVTGGAAQHRHHIGGIVAVVAAAAALL